MYWISLVVYTEVRGVAMDIKLLEKIGQRVRELRKEKGISQEALGEKAGFHFSYIGGIERAEKNITIANLQKIAEALDVPIVDLFLYSKYEHMGNSEREALLNSINEKLFQMKTNDLIKVQLLLSELFDK